MAEPKHVEPFVLEKISNILIFIALIALVAVVWWDIARNSQVDEQATISTFEECVEAGNPVMDSYPQQCMDDEGNTFVDEVTPDEYSQDEVKPITEGVVMTGELICLQHRDVEEFETMECAFGLLADESEEYYALQDADETQSMLHDIDVGTQIEVIGERKLEPSDRYQAAGTIYVNALTVLDN